MRALPFLGAAAALCLTLLASAARADTTVVADVQVKTRTATESLLQIRSTAPQAFDLSPASTVRQLVLQLHGARLGRGLTAPKAPFGRIKLLARRDGDVLVRVRLRRGWTAKATQGSSPNTVDVHVGR